MALFRGGTPAKPQADIEHASAGAMLRAKKRERKEKENH